VSETLPQTGQVLSYYGDDFTGSTDALEVLGANGFSPVLFLKPPSREQIARFPDCRAIGIAGVSRSRSPEWMSSELPSVFEGLKRLGAQVCHYKVCSTFDSSPETGSIGRALEIGQKVFAVPYVPVVVGVPSMGRYTLFGNLFANYHGTIYRIDRHPAMMSHPVTPMTESDLRLHLSRQTQKRIGLLDIVSLRHPHLDDKFREVLAGDPDAILFDVLDQQSLIQVGRILWSRRPPGGSFIVGSSGVEYALVAYWRAAGLLPPPPEFRRVAPVDRLVVVSGSCSPKTERQILWSLDHGFVGIPINADALVASDSVKGDRSTWASRPLAELARGRSIVLYTALGEEDSARARDARGGESSFGMRLGEQLGTLLRELVCRAGVRRVLVAGGDTASHVGQQLSLEALTMLSPMIPGAPLCRAHSREPGLDGLELVLKGGQVGSDDCFGRVQLGQSVESAGWRKDT
jgi:uncharacterized protein YgbK (DUF1537 family)